MSGVTMKKGIATHKEVLNETLIPSMFFNDDFTSPLIDRFSNHFCMSRFEMALYIYIIQKEINSYGGGGSDLSDLFDKDEVCYGDESYLKVFKAVENLAKQSFLVLAPNELKNKSLLDPEIQIDQYKFIEIITGEGLQSAVNYKDIYSITNYVKTLFGLREENKISYQKFIKDFEYVSKHIDKSLPISSYLLKYNLIEQFLILLLVYNKLDPGSISVINFQTTSFINSIYEENEDKFQFLHNVLEENLVCIKDKIIIANQNSIYVSDPELKISDIYFHKFLNSTIKTAIGFESEKLKYLKYQKLKHKLFLNKSTQIQIDTISKVASKREYKKLQKRLQQADLPSGVVSLFFGSPGTGKTASVYEIAKKTKRDVLQVNISAIRDKYIGNSEKQIKSIFEEYERAKEELKTVPILLFNEADALIGRRIDTESSVDIMNNAMQNILLEELENFNGILIATTNMIDNMDDAFSRRFLFKVQFEKPGIEEKTKIWRSKIPTLNSDMLKHVVGFELSGGEIENIARKVIIESVIHDREIVTEFLVEACKSELSLTKDKNILGFGL